MRLLRFLCLTLVTLSVLVTHAEAIPSFLWTEPWDVTLLPKQCGGPPTLCESFVGRAFGTSAMFDGQIRDVTADVAVAKSQWSAGNAASIGGTSLQFSRTFLLSESPQGWNINLSGLLNGTLTAAGNSGFGAPSASVQADATISMTPLHLTWSERVSGPPPFQPVVNTLSVNHMQSATAFVSDGTYTVTGSLATGAGSLGNVAFSDFFASGFQVSVGASPLPEPSSVWLCSTGLAILAWQIFRQTKRARRNERECNDAR